MQAKGYGLPAIAELLSDNGLAITAKTLKTYLSEARAAGGRKKRVQDQGAPIRGAGAAATAPTTESKPAWRPSAGSGDAPHGARVRRQGGSRGDDAGDAPATPAAAKATKGTTRPSDDAGARRSAFVPKEDTRDI